MASAISHSASSSSASSSSMASPPAIESAKRLANYFCMIKEHQILNCGVPLYTLFQTKMINLITKMTQLSTHFYETMLLFYQTTEHGRKVPFLKQFLHPHFDAFRKENNFGNDVCLYTFHRILSQSFQEDGSMAADLSPLLSFLNFTKLYIKRATGRESTEMEQNVYTFLDYAIETFQHKDFSILKKTPFELGLFPGEFAPVHRYRAAMKNYVFLLLILHHLCLFQKIDISLAGWNSLIGTEDEIGAFFKFHIQNIILNLNRKTSLPIPVRVHLLLLIRRPIQRLLQTQKNLTETQNRLFSLPSLKYYQDVICTEKVEKIAATLISNRAQFSLKKELPSILPIDLKPVYPTYAEEHRDVFENFLPRVREMADYLLETSLQAQKDLLVFREFSLFLLFGDIDKLLARLKAAKGSQDIIDHLVFEEINTFYKRHKENKDFAAPPDYLLSLKPFQELERRWAVTPRAVRALLKDKLELGNQWEKDLLPPASKKPLKRSRKNIEIPLQETPAAKDDPLTIPSQELLRLETSQPETSCEETPFPPSFLSSSKLPQNAKPPLPEPEKIDSDYFTEPLETKRRLLHAWLTRLSSGRSPYTQEALSNAYEHFDSLLCSMRRIHNHCGKAFMSRQILFSFINDTVRHCSLGVEQLLSALCRETHGIKSQQELSPYLTHDLFELLQNCNLDQCDFPHSVRKWIQEINQGEIIIRDFGLYSWRRGVLSNLLRENRQLQAFSDKPLEITPDLFSALHNYLSPLGELLETVQYTFPSQGKLEPIPLEDPFFDMVSTYCHELSQMQYRQVMKGLGEPVLNAADITRDHSLKASNDPAFVLLRIRELLKKFEKTDLSAKLSGRLDNVLNNLLVHLETEALSHHHLEPIEASLYLSNILLLNQLIAESVLINKLHAIEIPTDFEEESQHDLLNLAEKLNISPLFNTEEMNFLKFGKLSRRFIRYPALQMEPATSEKLKKSQQKKPRSSSSQSSYQAATPRPDKIKLLLKASRQLANKQSASSELKGFTPANRADAKKLEEIKAFAAQDIQLLYSILRKIL